MFPDEDAHPYTLYEPYAKTLVGTPEHVSAYDVGLPRLIVSLLRFIQRVQI